jgi:hypothetical protein
MQDLQRHGYNLQEGYRRIEQALEGTVEAHMYWYWLGLAAGGSLLVVLLLEWLRRRYKGALVRARSGFLQQREHLEADFFHAASRSGRPRGLRWINCDWESNVLFARDRQTRQLIALVGVTIQFEAVEGSDMEGLPAVGNLRNASGVFFFERGRWRTIGKVVYNLNPDETLEHFHEHYERIEA